MLDCKESIEHHISPSLAYFMARAPWAVLILKLEDFDDLGSLRYLCANEAAVKVIGSSFHTIIGKTFREATPELLDTDLPATHREALLSQTPIDYGNIEYGDSIVQESTFFARAVPLGPDTLAVCFDNANAMRKAQKGLVQQKLIFDAILGNGSICVSQIDNRGNFINAVGDWHRYLGFRGRRLKQRNAFATFPDRHEFLTRILRGKSEDFISQAHGLHIQNMIFPDGHGGAFHLAYDITKLKQAERELQLTQQRFQAALKGSNIIVFNQDTNLRYTWRFDPRGKSYEVSVLGKTDHDRFPKAEADRLTTIKKRVMQTGIAEQQEVTLSVEGKKATYLLDAQPTYDGDGVLTGLLCTALDMTERMRREKDERRLEAEKAHNQHLLDLAHIARVNTMGELATGIAHELNQPLAAIVGYTHGCCTRIRSGKLNKDQLLETLTHIELQTQRAGKIIRRMCDFVRKEPPHKEWLNLDNLIQESVELLSMDIKNNQARIHFAFSTPNLHIQADKIQIQQVLINILRNSLDSFDSIPRQDREINVMTQCTEPERCEIIIADKGHGFDSDVAEQMFDQFYSTKQGGLGMGLPITRSILEAHGGDIDIHSTLGSGTINHIRLPLKTSGETAHE